MGTIARAGPPLDFVPPCLSPGLVEAGSALLPLWLKTRTPIAEFESRGAERLATLFHEFQEGKVRFLMAFRHPGRLDGLVLGRLLGHDVARAAKFQGTVLRRRPHTYFLYDRGVLLQTGRIGRWLYPHMGGISVQRGKLDRSCLRAAREIFANGDYPLAIAPEGAVNGLNDVVSPCEPGVAQMAFWCLEDLRDNGRMEKVFIVPIGIRYEYLVPPWQALERALGEMEAQCGVRRESGVDRYGRLLRLGEHLLGLLEAHYLRFHRRGPSSGEDVPSRLRSLLDASLLVAEEFFGLQPKGTLSERCRRIEQAGWDRIHREDLKQNALTPLARGLADHVAEEAAARMWHMRLVEGFTSVSGSYVREKATACRFAEMISILDQTIQHLEGRAEIDYPALGKQRAIVSVEPPICVDDRWEHYRSSRASAKEAVVELTAQIQEILQRTALEGPR